jgi:hypothetical protein
MSNSPYPLGTKQVQRPKTYRLRIYIRLLGWVIAMAALIFGLLATIQILFHPFDFVIETADKGLAFADQTLTKDTVAGVSIGSLVLVAVIAALPLLKKGVQLRQYALSFWRGLLSSAIFLATDRLYNYVKSIGLLYLSATLGIFIAVTIFLVEVVSRTVKVEAEAETRTELLASIVSGLVFGLLVQLGGYAIQYLSHLAL